MTQVIRVGCIDANLSPDAFHMYAIHYYKCKQDFSCPDSFSPVPYFLLCRAIELEIKSRHLKHEKQTKVKTDYGHKLLKAYNDLDQKEQTLDSTEVNTLKAASDIYASKGFEYFVPQDALTGYSRYPGLVALDSIAKKLIGL